VKLREEGERRGVIALDVYGTLVDPGGMALRLGRAFGTRAQSAAQLWREKQLEFTFRRALMRRYEDFDTCTLQALRYVGAALDVTLDPPEERALLDAYLHLPAFADARDGLAMLKRAGYRLVALTNGTERSARTVLHNAGLDEYLEAILSADRIATFKPDPAIYALVQTLHAKEPAWLVSGNPFDVIGAKAAGLKAAWLRRDAQRIFDPWEFAPDVVVRNLAELCEKLPPAECVAEPQ
jgi:2-haloacid dehalogenase